MKPSPKLVDDYLHRVLTCVDMIQQSSDNINKGDRLYALLGIADWTTELHHVMMEIYDTTRETSTQAGKIEQPMSAKDIPHNFTS